MIKFEKFKIKKGVGTIKKGAGTLKKGMGSLRGQGRELQDKGMGTLKKGMGSLRSPRRELRDMRRERLGAMEAKVKEHYKTEAMKKAESIIQSGDHTLKEVVELVQQKTSGFALPEEVINSIREKIAEKAIGRRMEIRRVKNLILGGSRTTLREIAETLQKGAFEHLQPTEVLHTIAKMFKERAEDAKTEEDRDIIKKEFKKNMVGIIRLVKNPDNALAAKLIEEGCTLAVAENREKFSNLSAEVTKSIDTFVTEKRYEAGLKMQDEFSEEDWEKIENETERDLNKGKKVEEILAERTFATQEAQDAVQDFVQAEELSKIVQEDGEEIHQEQEADDEQEAEEEMPQEQEADDIQEVEQESDAEGIETTAYAKAAILKETANLLKKIDDGALRGEKAAEARKMAESVVAALNKAA